MLAQRLRRWPNIETALVECYVFAGIDVLASFFYGLLVVGSEHPLYIVGVAAQWFQAELHVYLATPHVVRRMAENATCVNKQKHTSHLVPCGPKGRICRLVKRQIRPFWVEEKVLQQRLSRIRGQPCRDAGKTYHVSRWNNNLNHIVCGSWMKRTKLFSLIWYSTNPPPPKKKLFTLAYDNKIHH